MNNPFKTLDDGIMYFTKGVYAYNWTTGGTKAELANTLLGVAPVFEAGAWLVASFLGLTASSIGLFMSHLLQKRNTEIEIDESKALENGMKDLNVEDAKNFNCGYGYSHFLSALYIGHIASLEGWQNEEKINIETIGYTGLSMGYLMRSLGCFVMRTEYLPPRKHALSRAKDKLVEIVNDYTRKPATIPLS